MREAIEKEPTPDRCTDAADLLNANKSLIDAFRREDAKEIAIADWVSKELLDRNPDGVLSFEELVNWWATDAWPIHGAVFCAQVAVKGRVCSARNPSYNNGRHF